SLRTLFVAHRLPLHGLENEFAPTLPLSEDMFRSLHVIPQSQIEQWLTTGYFDTVCLEQDDEDKFQALRIAKAYVHSAHLNGGFDIFWGRASSSGEPQPGK